MYKQLKVFIGLSVKEIFYLGVKLKFDIFTIEVKRFTILLQEKYKK